ncbi:MAG: ABC transporter permease [Rhizobiaceae bacterium]
MGNLRPDLASLNLQVTPIEMTQERMVLGISLLLFVIFSFTLSGFLTFGNLFSLLQGVTILGILGIGMAIVVISRGIDLSMVAIMVFSVGWTFSLVDGGMSLGLAILLGLGFALFIGILNGFLIAYAEIPSIFATLSVAIIVAGFGRFALVSNDNVYLPISVDWIIDVGTSRIVEIPMPVIVFGVLACLALVVLRYTKFGRFVYALGDNPLAARISGIPTRPVTVMIYTISAFIAFAAGLVMAATVSTVNTKLANTTMIYDVILVVVIGGVGLTGGKGGIRNVIVGTILIGLLLNGMTIMNLSVSIQNIVKSMVLLTAIVLDSIVNPRDEQTSQQGDI